MPGEVESLARDIMRIWRIEWMHRDKEKKKLSHGRDVEIKCLMKVYVSPTVSHKTLAVAPDRNSCMMLKLLDPPRKTFVFGAQKYSKKTFCENNSRRGNISSAKKLISVIWILMLFTFSTRINFHMKNFKKKLKNKNLHKRWNGSLWFFYNFIFMVDFFRSVLFVRPQWVSECGRCEKRERSRC